MRAGPCRARKAPDSYTVITMRSILAACLLALASCATTATTSRSAGDASGKPRDGRTLLARMHDRYAGTWFRTLTFVQRTVQRRPDGTEQMTTWYEAQSGPRLRIDVGDPALGNGVLYTADSLYVVREGKVVRRQAEGNPFLPLVVSAYLGERHDVAAILGRAGPARRHAIPHAARAVAGMTFPASFFQAERWMDGPHWASAR